MSNAPATAVYNDSYAGEVAAVLLPFKTKRNGQTVVRYRWRKSPVALLPADGRRPF